MFGKDRVYRSGVDFKESFVKKSLSIRVDDLKNVICETALFLENISNLQHKAANAHLMVMFDFMLYTFELRMLLTVNGVLLDTRRLLNSILASIARCQGPQATVCWTALSRNRVLSSCVIAPSDLLSWIVWQEDKHICEQCIAFCASGLECPCIIGRHF